MENLPQKKEGKSISIILTESMSFNDIKPVLDFINNKEGFSKEDIEKENMTDAQKNLLLQYLDKLSSETDETQPKPLVKPEWQKDQWSIKPLTEGEDTWKGGRQVVFLRKD